MKCWLIPEEISFSFFLSFCNFFTSNEDTGMCFIAFTFYWNGYLRFATWTIKCKICLSCNSLHLTCQILYSLSRTKTSTVYRYQLFWYRYIVCLSYPSSQHKKMDNCNTLIVFCSAALLVLLVFTLAIHFLAVFGPFSTLIKWKLKIHNTLFRQHILRSHRFWIWWYVYQRHSFCCHFCFQSHAFTLFLSITFAS